ncbi:MAG: type II toxin-antitoxin system VapC family toxin [Nitrospirae bacterium]|nr:type II toxin-antitoxin system VapC family toxin [Nitrospirota bacterium]
MRLLLDTCSFVWLITAAPDLSPAARDACEDPANDIFLSSASVWEIVTKHGSGKIRLADAPDKIISTERKRLGIVSLALDDESALQAERLPLLHKDPFDRMLICQAIVHGLTILTPDGRIRQYPVRTLW